MYHCYLILGMNSEEEGPDAVNVHSNDFSCRVANEFLTGEDAGRYSLEAFLDAMENLSWIHITLITLL